MWFEHVKLAPAGQKVSGKAGSTAEGSAAGVSGKSFVICVTAQGMHPIAVTTESSASL